MPGGSLNRQYRIFISQAYRKIGQGRLSLPDSLFFQTWIHQLHKDFIQNLFIGIIPETVLVILDLLLRLLRFLIICYGTHDAVGILRGKH